MNRIPVSAALGAALVVGVVSGVTPAPTAAQATDTITVTVGMPAPDFELEDAYGTPWRLSDLTPRGPVVLEFFRSGGW